MTSTHIDPEAAELEGFVAVDYDAAAQTLIANFRAIRASRDAATAALAEVKDQLAKHMAAEGANVLTLGGLPAVRISHVTKVDFDSKKFKEDHPELAKEYVRVSETTRLTVTPAEKVVP